MIKSMTAYATADPDADDLSISIEMRGYNSRYLDISIKMPNAYAVLEDKLRRAVSEAIVRGRIEIRVTVSNRKTDNGAFVVNEPAAAAYVAALNRLKTKFAIHTDIDLSLLAQQKGIIETAEPSAGLDAAWDLIEQCLPGLLAEFDAVKIREGQNIIADLKPRIADIEAAITRIESRAAGLLEYHQNRLKERIQGLTYGLVAIDEGRIAQEAAILADRTDISEEIVRARSHLGRFIEIADGESAGGRPLNFLIQELNREFNTMGSKAANASISQEIVSVKTELEKIREQVQNVE
ncbi:MAG: YicC family protein [Desulfobacteraceae bacterium]|jgi:uncharacterized protein (TIGR00255 family)|nr:MAG: YicC family protein [Desulfobacteraceae bacterium]